MICWIYFLFDYHFLWLWFVSHLALPWIMTFMSCFFKKSRRRFLLLKVGIHILVGLVVENLKRRVWKLFCTQANFWTLIQKHHKSWQTENFTHVDVPKHKWKVSIREGLNACGDTEAVWSFTLWRSVEDSRPNFNFNFFFFMVLKLKGHNKLLVIFMTLLYLQLFLFGQ